jgi:dimethylamine monooxygenase subunit A
MGLRPLDLANWLEFDEHYDAERAQKSELLAQHYDDVVATQPDGEAGSRELLAAVVAALHAARPDVAVDLDDRDHPIVAASRLVQEDLCVVVKDDAWRLRAACVCFPSRWVLASKIGTTLDEIHAPVPHYDEELARPTTALFDRLQADRSFWRLNWTLLDSPALHQPTAARVAPSGQLADWYFRVERQTLRRLPISGAVVFTIRTYVTSAAALAREDGEFLPALLHAMDTASPDTQSYKGWTGVATRLRDALGAQ